MATSSSSKKRKRVVDSGEVGGRTKIDEGTLRDIAKMVRRNSKRHFDITPQDIVEIAKMSQANMRQRRGAVKFSRNHYNVDKIDIENLVGLIEAKRRKLKTNTFKIRQLAGHIRLGYNEYLYEVSIGPNNTGTLPDFLSNLREVFNYFINIMNYIASSPTDKARLYISKAPNRCFSTAILNVADFNAEMFFDVFERHMQSNAQEILDNGWQSIISLYIFPNKYVSRKKRVEKKKKKKRTTTSSKLYKYLGKNVREWGQGRKKQCVTKHGREVRHGIFQIKTTNDCFAFALLVARSFVDQDVKYQTLHKKPNTPLDTLYTNEQITDIYKRCGVVQGSGVRIDQLHKFYEILLRPNDLDLVVFLKQQNDTIVYDSRLNVVGNLARANAQIVYLWLNDNHYDVVISPYVFLKYNTARFCFACMNFFRRKGETRSNHVCRTAYTCHSCYAPRENCGDEGVKHQCPLCDVIFRNAGCYKRHLVEKIFKIGKTGKSETPCQSMFFCQTCYKKVQRMTCLSGGKRTKHKCDEVFCNHCNALKKKTHECFVKPCRVHANASHPTLYFFDFETKKDDEGYMIPFYCVVQKVCTLCDEKPFVRKGEEFQASETDKRCDTSVERVPCCGHRQYVFENNNANIVADLVDFMYLQKKNSVWVAHNGGRFDSVFLLRELLIERNIVPKVIMNGNQIMCMELEDRNLKVVDSFLFLSMALSKFPAALGIKDLTKGFHPYHFTDLTYVGPMIGVEYFDPPSEGTAARQTFDSWYAKQRKTTYNFRNAIYYYCRLDVDILRQGCVIFARLIKEITNVFPFYDKTCHTIAGLALKIYRSNFLEKNVIGQIPAEGYGGNVNQSTIALYWLRDVEKALNENNLVLRSKLCPQGEITILNKPVDGYCETTKTIYQFHGCFFHGCKNCYDGEDFNSVLNETYYTLRERTRRTDKLFETHGYKLITVWECDFMRESKLTHSSLKMLRHRDFFINVNLCPRDALFGGRTSPAILYFHSLQQKARYYDFTSLYPYVQKKYVYPTKHPTIIRGEAKCRDVILADVFGLIKCKILPPKGLLFPVLPCRTEKLTFPLCRTCVTLFCEHCTHDDAERALYGTWTSVEVHKALECGYKILSVYEIYHFKTRGKIFDTYVDTFMKLKQESSGIPKHCLDEYGDVVDEKLRLYISEYFKHEGVRLDADKIEYNPGQRTVMKALLNSLWGKLAQNEDATIVSFVDSMDELLELVNDNSIDVTSLDFISDDVARTTHRKNASLITLANRNVIIASFVTAYARLELFEVLQRLGKNVMYYDTDSVIYIEGEGHTLQTGSYLGELTDELAESGCSEKWIEHFCTAGPKSYSYKTNLYTRTHKDGTTTKERDEIVHVKGFTLKGDTAKMITFDTIKACVSDKERRIETSYRAFIRDNNQTINVQPTTKTFRFTFDKRIIRSDFTTIPYGYVG
jgi:hypothetical protein